MLGCCQECKRFLQKHAPVLYALAHIAVKLPRTFVLDLDFFAKGHAAPCQPRGMIKSISTELLLKYSAQPLHVRGRAEQWELQREVREGSTKSP